MAPLQLLIVTIPIQRTTNRRLTVSQLAALTICDHKGMVVGYHIHRTPGTYVRARLRYILVPSIYVCRYLFTFFLRVWLWALLLAAVLLVSRPMRLAPHSLFSRSMCSVTMQTF